MKIKTIAIVGCGVIGIGWAGRFLASGFNVIATDPAKNAEKKLKEGINNAWPSPVSYTHLTLPTICSV